MANLYQKAINSAHEPSITSPTMADNEERKINRERAIAAVKQNHQLFISMAVGNLFSENSLKKHANAIEQLKKEVEAVPDNEVAWAALAQARGWGRSC